MWVIIVVRMFVDVRAEREVVVAVGEGASVAVEHSACHLRQPPPPTRVLVVRDAGRTYAGTASAALRAQAYGDT